MAVSLSSFVVAAETTVYSKAAARSGEPARVAYYFTVSANCKVSSLPISVAAAPAHGVAVVKESRVKTKRAKRCGEVEGPTNILYYKSNVGYTGDDTLTYKVTNSSGKSQQHVVQIKVSPGSGNNISRDKPI
ncbi:MAG: hypothetical protein WB663_12585 [Beijerinckiaceae bacterium]|jgi:hypothetical protein